MSFAEEANNITELRRLDRVVKQLKSEYVKLTKQRKGMNSHADVMLVMNHLKALERARKDLLQHAETLLKTHAELMSGYGFVGPNGKVASRYAVHTQFEKLRPTVNDNGLKKLMLARNITQFARPVIELEGLGYAGAQILYQLQHIAGAWWQRWRAPKAMPTPTPNANNIRVRELNRRIQAAQAASELRRMTKATAKNPIRQAQNKRRALKTVPENVYEGRNDPTVWNKNSTGRGNKIFPVVASPNNNAPVNSSVLSKPGNKKGHVINTVPTGRLTQLKKNGRPLKKHEILPYNTYEWGKGGVAF